MLAEEGVVLLDLEPGAIKLSRHIRVWSELMAKGTLEQCISLKTGWKASSIPNKYGHIEQFRVPLSMILFSHDISRRLLTLKRAPDR